MTDSFLEYIKEQFSVLGPIHIRKMFGGAGIFLDGVMFGLVADDTVYLKVDDSNKQDYIDNGMGPFVYMGKKKPIAMSYYQLPEECMEDIEMLRIWGQKAVTVAVKSA
jgi:DNA transformation protein